MALNEPAALFNTGPNNPSWTELLRDGTKVGIRPVTKRDAAAEHEFIEALSPEARRYRFLGQLLESSSEFITRVREIDYSHETAFAAVLQDGEKERFLGVGRYSTTTDGSSCECAVTVLDEWHHKGIGTVLMRHLIEIARTRGILYMFSIDAATNVDMAEFAKYLGFTRSIDPKSPTQAMNSLWL